MLVARRGLGADELDRASPAFLAAVRWATFAERLGSDLAEMRANAKASLPAGLVGQAVIDFHADRRLRTQQVAAIDAVLYPVDD